MIFGEQGALGYGSGTHGHMIWECKSNCKDQVGKINLNFVSDVVTAGLTAQDCIACALKWFLVTLQHPVQLRTVYLKESFTMVKKYGATHAAHAGREQGTKFIVHLRIFSM